MNTIKKNGIKLNCLLTQMIIKLHENGFSEDFIENEGIYTCIQCNKEFSSSNLKIDVYNLAFDNFSGRCKYVHTVETHSGLKGVLIADSLHFNSFD